MATASTKLKALIDHQVGLAQSYEVVVGNITQPIVESGQPHATADFVAQRLRELLAQYRERVLDPTALTIELAKAFAEVHMLQVALADANRRAFGEQ